MSSDKYIAVYSDSSSLDCTDCAFVNSEVRCSRTQCVSWRRKDLRGVVFLTLEDFAARKLRGEVHELAK